MKSSKERQSQNQFQNQLQKQQPKKPHNRYARFSGIAFQMAATIFVGAFIGVQLDKKYPNESNLYTTIFSLVFVLASLFIVIKQIMNVSKKEDE